MDAIAEDMKDMPPREVNTNMLANAADAMFTAGMWECWWCCNTNSIYHQRIR
jgi:hypothetical protein